jgi:hypothetical protein
MNFPSNPVLRRQIPLVAQIIRQEIMLEAERRGQTVPSDDPVVRANVCAALLRFGSDLRKSALQRIAAEVTTAMPVRHFTASRAA